MGKKPDPHTVFWVRFGAAVATLILAGYLILRHL
jgi:hypothetical protein